ncbi:MAG: aspartate/glutamate racemase family protein [Phycisphaerae bacterium]|nr:aspartate/glutamate racemase family protein [Saprospiraceae bacterium]
MIGIVGGIGPMAGADLYKKIVENTVANTDQEHLPVLLASIPNEIVDRTEYLLGKTSENPAPALAKIVLMLEGAGSKYIGIACNTAHAPQIFDPMLEILGANGSQAEVVNMIDGSVQAIQTHPAKIQRVGLLSTSGTYKTRIYQDRLEAAGLMPVVLDFEQHEALSQRAIYEIKASPTNIPQSPIAWLNTAIQNLKSLGAQAIILGCTELGMIEERLDLQGLAVFNPNLILARTLIERAFPGKLKA